MLIGRFKRERIYVYLWPIHVDVWQKPIQYSKAIILQLKIINFLKKILLIIDNALCTLKNLFRIYQEKKEISYEVYVYLRNLNFQREFDSP